MHDRNDLSSQSPDNAYESLETHDRFKTLGQSTMKRLKGSNIKSHGWFTGFMPGATIKYGKPNKYLRSNLHSNSFYGYANSSYNLSPKS